MLRRPLPPVFHMPPVDICPLSRCSLTPCPALLAVRLQAGVSRISDASQPPGGPRRVLGNSDSRTRQRRHIWLASQREGWGQETQCWTYPMPPPKFAPLLVVLHRLP